MSEKKFFHNFFYDNRVILILSVVFALIFWVFVALECSPEETRVVEDVPVVIDLKNSVPSQFGLQIFGTSEFYVDITVVGKRYEVSTSALTADDFSATAQTSYVDSEGKHTLQVKVISKDADADYEITGYSSESIEVYFDTYTEGEYTLVTDVQGDSYIPEGYIAQDSIISTSKVLIGGPSTEIAKIDRVIARVIVDDDLTATTTLKAEIIPMNEYGGTLRYLTIDSGGIDVTITIPVYKKVEVKTTVAFKNAPAYYIQNPLVYTCKPSTVTMGIPESTIDDKDEFCIGTIDFSELSKGNNTFTIKTTDVSGAVVLDDIKAFTVTVNVPDVIEKSVNINCQNIKIGDSTEDYSLSIAQSGSVSVSIVGDADSISVLDLTNITAVAVTPENIIEGSQKLEMRLYLNSADNCWIKGSYKISVDAKTVEKSE